MTPEANVLFFPSGVNLRIDLLPPSDKKITRSIKDYVIYAFRHKPICERALRSIGRVFGDRAAVVVCHEQITFAVKGLVPGVSVDGNQYCSQAGDCYCYK